MPRFFVDKVSGDTIEITGDDARHIKKSLRMKPGEQIVVCDGSETEHICRIESAGETVLLKIDSSAPGKNEPGIKLRLFQALPKGDKLEYIIQKAVELGIYEIIPVLTSRCVSRPDKKSSAKKRERYQKIALEAAKQSGRGIIPQVRETVTLNEAFSMMSGCESKIVFYELGGERINDIIDPDCKSADILIGSEGGFSEQEIELCEKNGMKTATLGARILRCETAPVAAVSIIMNITGNI